MTYIHHVTLTTGHVRRSDRSEVEPATWPVVRDLLESALDGYEPVIPHVEPRSCTLLATATARCMVADVIAPYCEGPGSMAPLVTIGVAAHSRCGSQLWRQLHQGGGLATRSDEVPPEPWCAARLELGLAHWPEAAHWLGDLERCLAWAWIERVEAMSHVQSVD